MAGLWLRNIFASILDVNTFPLSRHHPTRQVIHLAILFGIHLNAIYSSCLRSEAIFVENKFAVLVASYDMRLMHI